MCVFVLVFHFQKMYGLHFVWSLTGATTWDEHTTKQQGEKELLTNGYYEIKAKFRN